MAPEKLNLWDRFFNRYRQEVLEQGTEGWTRTYTDPWGNQVGDEKRYARNFVVYRIIDRLTGSETIKKVYLTPKPAS